MSRGPSPRRDALLVVLSMSAAAGLLLLYVRTVSGRLAPAEFGAAGSLLSVLLAASLPFGALQAAIARAIAESGGGEGEARALAGALPLACRSAAIAAPLLGLGWLALPARGGSAGSPIGEAALLASCGAALAFYHAALGTLLGRRSLLPFAVAAVAEPAARLLAFLLLARPDSGATLAVGACLPTAAGIGLLVLRRAPRGTAPVPVPLATRHVLGAAALGLSAYAAPLLLDPRRVGEEEAGRFFAAAHASRFLITLPLPFAMAMVRAVAGRRVAGLPVARPFWLTALFLAVTFAWILANLALFPDWFVLLLLDPGVYAEIAPRLLPLGLGSALYGLLVVPLFLGIALRRASALAVVAGLGVALLLVRLLGPGTERAAVLAWTGGGAVAAAVSFLLAARWTKRASPR